MFSARTIFEEIFDNDEAFGLFCSLAASGEGQGGWENGRIAALVPDSQADLAPKIARHGTDEDRHGRIFNEDNHLAYCHEELLRLAAAGHAEVIRRTLRAAALAEIAIYRDVSTAVMAHLGRILGWSRPKAVDLAAGIHAVYVCERLGGWRRMVSLRMPDRRNALGGPAPAPAPAQPRYA
jgi:hypothetical protein